MTYESSIVFLPCSDLEATRRFYADVVGLKLDHTQPGGALIFDTGYGYWGFVRYGDGRPLPSGPQGVCLSLNCRSRDEVDQMFEAVAARGATVRQPPRQHARFPVYSAFLADPDGYTVELQFITQ